MNEVFKNQVFIKVTGQCRPNVRTNTTEIRGQFLS